MGQWKLKNGETIELIFDEEGNFIEFGKNISEEKIKMFIEEINLQCKINKKS